jgi:hypothetical protein
LASISVISPSEERLKRLWLKAMAKTDSAEVESLLTARGESLDSSTKKIFIIHSHRS